MQVHGFSPALLRTPPAEDFCQAPGVVDPQDVDVILTAEGLDEGEVDLQGHVLDVVIVGGQDAQNHIIGVPERRRKGNTWARGSDRTGGTARVNGRSLHVERLGRLVHADCDAALGQGGGEDFFQGFGH